MTDFPQQEMPFVPYQTARTLRGREKNKQTKRHEADMKQEQKHVFSMLLYRRINTKSFKIIYSPKKKKKKMWEQKHLFQGSLLPDSFLLPFKFFPLWPLPQHVCTEFYFELRSQTAFTLGPG